MGGKRIAIVGWPGSGKSTLARKLRDGSGLTVRGTDDLVREGLAWSEVSEAASTWFDEPGGWIIEGTAVARALRKWRNRNPGLPPPVDMVVRTTTIYRELSPRTEAMGKAIDTVLAEIADWLPPMERVR